MYGVCGVSVWLCGICGWCVCVWYIRVVYVYSVCMCVYMYSICGQCVGGM